MNVAYLCLGGNIGNRIDHINHALQAISVKVGELLKKSDVYETEAWGVENEQPYLNQVVEISTVLSPEELLQATLDIETQLGRTRSGHKTYEARTIDIDILFYNQVIIQLPDLVIPHPRLHLRNFVLAPMKDVNPTFIHPVFHKNIISLMKECADTLEVKPYRL